MTGFRPTRLSTEIIFEDPYEDLSSMDEYSDDNMGSSVTTNAASFEDSIPHAKEKDLPDGGNWVVQKFGGTSLGKYAEGICEIVRDSLRTSRVAVVCSARSHSTKTDGTTSRLLRAAKEAKHAASRGYVDIVDTIQADHIAAARDTITSSAILSRYTETVEQECQTLVKILESAQHLEEVSPGVENKIISRGEILACYYLAALLEDKGVATQVVDFSDVIRAYNINKARSGFDPGFYSQLAQAFAHEISECGERVPIVTGYFGNVPNGLLNSIGRGYTDLCAALVAVGVEARELQVWKEVDGIFTADPRKVPTARLIPSVTPAEAAELTFYGSEVIHPFTMEQVIRARIPIRIRNVTNPRGSGTIIQPDPLERSSSGSGSDDPTRPRIFRTRSASMLANLSKPKRPTAVTIKHSIIVLNVHSNKRTRAQGFLTRIFSILDAHDLSVDLIASSEVHVSMALHSERPMVQLDADEEYKILDQKLHRAVTDLAELGHVDLASDMAIVSLVGKELKKYPGISGRFFSVLGENHINIEMISQGASEINISCVIWARDADRALNVLHTNLFTFL